MLCRAVAGAAAARRQGDEGQRGTSGPRALGVRRLGVWAGDREGQMRSHRPKGHLGPEGDMGTEAQGCRTVTCEVRRVTREVRQRSEVRGWRIIKCGTEGARGDRGRAASKSGFA